MTIPYKALLVSTWDDPFILLKMVLERSGRYEVIWNDKPSQTLEIAREFQPDVIGSHDNMMGMDGLEMYQQVIQADPALALIPWLLITARSLPEDFAPYQSAGFKDWIILPFHPREIVGVFDKWCQFSRELR